MHHPIRIAEDFAMLDQLSDGRVNFGVGRGMSPSEYAIFGSSYDTAQARLGEALEIIVKGWSGETLDWQGEHYQYRGFTVRPRPRQLPHPPIYMTANRELDHFQMIGRRGYHLLTLPWIFTNELQRPKIEAYLDALRGAGHAVEDREVFVMYPTYVGITDDEARADARDRWHRWRQFVLEEQALEPGTERYAQLFEHLSYEAMVRDSRAVFGSPETCVRHLARIRDVVKPTHVGLTFHFAGLAQKKVLASMERFARFVRPALRTSA
jgi:alkanesulfonate monooxygenase SsuD/methylene tetrahydromethanopterin reductase-like flavin-dependent oxidoreductase (luciferase family)